MKKYLIALLIPLIVFSIAKNIVFVVTPSIDKTVLWKQKGKVFKGSYVSYQLNDDIIGNNLIIKKVGCDESENIILIGHDFYCNDEFIGSYKSKSKNGITLVHTNDLGKIPAGKVWLSGSHKDSYDSRYFGLVNKSDLLRLKPIL